MWSLEGPVPPEAVGPVAIVQLKSSVPSQSSQLQVPASKSHDDAASLYINLYKIVPEYWQLKFDPNSIFIGNFSWIGNLLLTASVTHI